MLSLRQLNRTLLQRQMLLERHTIPITEAVERLVGLQSQIPNPPYIGLWTRLQTFQRDDLTTLMEQRRIIRAAMMRSTLHLVTAEDHHRFRPVIEPALIKALSAFFGKRGKGLDVEKLVIAARPFVESEPRSTGDLKKHLLEVEPDADPDAMAYIIRTYLPLIQVTGGTWGVGSAATYTTAETHLGPMDTAADVGELFRRYLMAFGPTGVMDFQTWTGMTKLKDDIEALKPELQVYQTEDGKEVYDLPDATLATEDIPAPVRFIPEYDNILIAHADRTRIIADEHRKKVFLSAGRVASTILLDGFVQATWKIKRVKDTATLTISPFKREPLPDEVYAEGERLLRFVEDTAETYEVVVEQ